MLISEYECVRQLTRLGFKGSLLWKDEYRGSGNRERVIPVLDEALCRSQTIILGKRGTEGYLCPASELPEIATIDCEQHSNVLVPHSMTPVHLFTNPVCVKILFIILLLAEN
jgi:hypothetical protein